MRGKGPKRNVRIGEFTRLSLEEQAGDWGIELMAFIRQAVVYYLSDRRGQRPGWRLPPFRSRASAGRVESQVRVELPESEWSALEEEAKHQRADLDGLLEHAALYYLADLETGRVARRIAVAADEVDEGTAEEESSRRKPPS